MRQDCFWLVYSMLHKTLHLVEAHDHNQRSVRLFGTRLLLTSGKTGFERRPKALGLQSLHISRVRPGISCALRDPQSASSCSDVTFLLCCIDSEQGPLGKGPSIFPDPQQKTSLSLSGGSFWDREPCWHSFFGHVAQRSGTGEVSI